MLVKPKKSLGQNFLIDKNVIKKIVSISKILNKDVLEIGPGTGNLTEYILKEKPNKIFLIEKDKILCDQLRLKFQNKVVIKNDDILKTNENDISDNKLIVFGNLPYNISTKIVCNWILKLEQDFWFSELILMFQKEVADRIISKINSSNYGRLTIFLNWKMDIKKVFDISPTCFYPKPKIQSTLVHFTPKNNYFKLNESKNLEKITRIFFNQRRKKIKTPFNIIFKDNVNILNNLNINLNLRPHNISQDIYYKLTEEYEKLRC